MNSSRLLPALLLGCCLLLTRPLHAQDSPFGPGKQFSADQTITTKEGKTITDKIYMDDGKVRTEMSMSGMQIISIIRPDLKKIYTVMDAQKMVMEMPYDAAKIMKNLPPTTGDGKFETIGPDTVDGVACTKYKVTNKNGKVFFMWNDAAKKTPVKMTSEDGTFVMLWKNYQAGPQPASLFEPPSGYQVMAMPAAMPAPAAPSGQ